MLKRSLLLRHLKSIITLIKDLVNLKSYKQNRQLKVLYNRHAIKHSSLFTYKQIKQKKWWFLSLRKLLKNRHECRESILALRHRLYKLLNKRKC